MPILRFAPTLRRWPGAGRPTATPPTVTATKADGSSKTFEVKVLLLTPKEVEYFRNGGILQYVLRQLAAKKAA